MNRMTQTNKTSLDMERATICQLLEDRMRRFIFILTIILAAMIPGLAPALSGPHSSVNGISCNDCHSVHPVVLQGEEQETLCKSCHNPTGVAAAKSNVTSHRVNGGTLMLDCGTCHNPHDPSNSTNPNTSITSPNLKLIRDNVATYYHPALYPAVYHSSPQDFAFGDSATHWNGICQVCHTETAHHRQNATSGHSHGVGADCLSCHLHSTGFMPVGGDCITCHSVAQDNGDNVPPGGRRAVTGEFPSGNVHGHFGSTLDVDSCLACHLTTNHQGGHVELIDADNPATIYSFVVASDLTSDPDLSDFCASCHDDDGATRLAEPFNPFGNGAAPPDVATKFKGTLQWREWWSGGMCFSAEGTMRPVNSHHDISDTDQDFSGAKLECLNCHGAHTSADVQPVVDPFATNSPWGGTMNEFCLSCHSGGSGPNDPGFPPGVEGPDPTQVLNPYNALTSPTLRGLSSCAYQPEPWYIDYTWNNSVHGGFSKRPLTGYSGAPATPEMDCLVCHDSHGSYTSTNTAGNPYMIRDFVDGTPFIDDGVRPGAQWFGPPFTTTGTARAVVVSITGTGNSTNVNWGSANSLCGVCHASWLNAYSWHSYCTGCQSCHAHGAAWGEHDWVAPVDHVGCPTVEGPAPANQGLAPSTMSANQIQYLMEAPPSESDIPLHLGAR